MSDRAMKAYLKRASDEAVGPKEFLVQIFEGSSVTFVGPFTEAHADYAIKHDYYDKFCLKILMQKPISVFDPPDFSKIDRYLNFLANESLKLKSK